MSGATLGYCFVVVSVVSDRSGTGNGAVVSSFELGATSAITSDPSFEGQQRLEGAIVAERYRIEALLGQGGMGAVYRAEHIHMRKAVAVKVLHRQMTTVPEVVARFEREAIAAGNIDHPNVAAATDFGRLEDGSFYLVLEYADGRDLRSVLNEHGALSAQRCAHIAIQIAKALAAAHAEGIIHRDLKPENIMLVQRNDDADFVKVLDFGIAKVSAADSAGDKPLTQIGAVFGTPSYMSPEQALGKVVDYRSDLYALGILIFEMLMGSVPFDDDELAVVLAQQISQLPPAISAPVPDAMERLVDRLLEKDASKRPDSAQSVVDALQDIIDALGKTPSSTEGFSELAGTGGIGSTRLPIGGSRPSVGEDSRRFSLAPTWKNKLKDKLTRIRVTARRVVQITAHEGGRLLRRYAPSALEPVKLGPVRAPLWAFIGVGIATLSVFSMILFVLLGASWIASLKEPAPTLSSNVMPVISFYPSSKPPATLQAPSPAFEALERIAVSKRSVDDWHDLARGYARMGRTKDSVAAYRSVLQLDPKRGRDPEVLYSLRTAAKDPEAYPLVLNLAEVRGRGLGEAGPELLWDIWNDQRHAGDFNAENTFKKLVVVSGRCSGALRVAIDLRATDDCDKLQAVMSRAAKHADERSIERLVYIQGKTGCFEPDCFSCLKDSKDLEQALQQAKRRSAPTMRNGYR